MIRDQFLLDIHRELIVDLFAGGGGMSTAIEDALGRAPDIAVNHDDDAISMHRLNHPQTEHRIADVFEVCPREATNGRPVGLLHLSPDCTHHSQASGGQPRDRKIRALSWVGYRWAGQVRPRVITLENVTQILKWGPLIAKRDKATGRVLKLDGTIAAPGERVPVQQQYLVPDPTHAGRTWMRFVALLRSLGYVVEWNALCAADFGAPTTRERLFMVARCDGKPIVWPASTHAKIPARGQHKWRAAAECIDWSIPCPSIFERKRPLADATLRRIARGICRYVIESGDPFIVPITHHGADRVHDIRDPLRTITAAHRGEFAMVAPILAGVGGRAGQSEPRSAAQPLYTTTAKGDTAVVAATMVQMGYGEREGQAPRSLDIEAPLGTIVAGGNKFGIVSAFMAQMNGGFNEVPGHDLRRPVSTITNKGSQQQLVTAHLAHLRGNCDARAVTDPLMTVSAGGQHHGIVECTLSPEIEAGALRVAAFLIRYYGEGGQWGDLREPMATITTRDRLALVTVVIHGTPYMIVDIGLRMLTPRELYLAQGFPGRHIISHGHDGRLFSKSVQVRMVGNSVSPPPATALVWANVPEMATWSVGEMHRAGIAA